jgi:hypothetical protein
VEDQTIMVCARIYNDRSLPDGGCVVSISSTGQYNADFGTNGIADFPGSLKTLENFLVLPAANRIIGCGMGENRGALLVALTSQGAVDTLFQSSLLERDYSLTWNQLAAFSPQRADSRLLAAGLWNNRTNAPMVLGRFYANGEIDASFAEGGTGAILLEDMTSTAARRCEIDSSGKTLVHCMSTEPKSTHGTLVRCLTAVAN